MAGVIELSSDEEDYQEASRALPRVVKREGVSANGTLASSDGGAMIPENGQQHPHPPPVLLLNSCSATTVTKVRSPGIRRGRTTLTPKIEDPQGVVAMSPVIQSPRFSSWGDPLPPEPASHPLPDPGDGRIYTAAAGGAAENGNVGEDVLMRAAAVVGSSSPKLYDQNSPGVGSDGGVCRHFWRAGDYEAHHSGVKPTRGAMDHVRVHPKFLHSNATSHKWALGAVAELLDNAVDEIPNGATFVSVDRTVNPRDGFPALLVLDDGGGMSPDILRQCMSLGYSGKNTNTTIGQYGNGFKTSTMRLGADVIVFSRSGKEKGKLTQSIGLLSYTFLRKTGQEDVIVPMVDYEVSSEGMRRGDPFQRLVRSSLEDWHSNMASIMQWSPYSSEPELLHQFDDLGWHGTKVVIYNLWFNDDGVLELDFNSDETDIQLRGGLKQDPNTKAVSQQLYKEHISNRYHHSLRVYTSILYLKMPPGFQVILRGKPVEHHNLAADLKFPEQIIYKPLIGNRKDPPKETSVVTIIGFTKEAPLINVHGFNVYHKNRLIMPFWKVWQDNSSRGRGVVGVLEANFVEPAHDKQDFERTTVLLKLEARLKQMTVEYWNLHCHYIGYQPHSKAGKGTKKQTGSVDYPLPVASITPAGADGDLLGTPLPAESGGPEVVAAAPRASPLVSRASPAVSRALPAASRALPAASRATPAAPRGPPATFGNPAGEQGSKVKSEPVDGELNPFVTGKITEAAQGFKRRRLEGANAAEANINEGMELGGTSDSVIVVQQQRNANETMVVELLEENGQLKRRCADLEQDVKGLSSKVLKLEAELREVTMKNVIMQALRVSTSKAAAGI